MVQAEKKRLKQEDLRQLKVQQKRLNETNSTKMINNVKHHETIVNTLKQDRKNHQKLLK